MSRNQRSTTLVRDAGSDPFGGSRWPKLGQLMSLVRLARPEFAGRDRKVLRCDPSAAARRTVPLQLVHHHSQYG